MSSGVYDKYTGFHNRGSIRLPGYDYSRQGYYFITICIHDRNRRFFGDIIGAYKSLVANACLKIYKSKNERMGKLWQRYYFEHIIRDSKSLYFIRNYIRENPVNWFVDAENHIDKEIHEFEMKEIGEGYAPKSFH